MSVSLRCSACGATYALSAPLPWRCEKCTGLLDLAEPLRYDAAGVDARQPGLWKYRSSFGLPDDLQPVSMGEGNTPLVEAVIDGQTVHVKLDYLMPTGSYKDRGTTVLVSVLAHLGIDEAVEDSSGNAGASFAAYAARAGLRARVFVPERASAGKLAQMAAFGARLEKVPGPRSKASEAVQAAAASGVTYASHNYLPLGSLGLATAAFEIVEQLGGAPGTVVLPVGHGSNFVGLWRGFKALQAAGVIGSLPQMVGVQAEACAPLWAVWRFGLDGLGFVTEGETLAEGIRSVRPVRGDASLQVAGESGGGFVTVNEVQIDGGRNALARMGFYVEHTSAVVWAGVRQVLAEGRPGPVVVVLTGSGLKQTPVG